MEKLRKALQKAGYAEAFESPGGPVESWRPPAYDASRRVEIDARRLEKHRCVGYFPDTPEIETYKVLRTKITQRMKAAGWRTLMVTSAVAGEGKSLTAVNLALTFAREFNQTVLLVDCDFRNQRIHEILGYDSDSGLIDYLVERRPLRDLIVWPGIDKLTVISGGRTVRDSTELLNSPQMAALVAEMAGRYDDRYIIFDVPAMLDGADAMAFSAIVEGILMVVRSGSTPLRNVRKAVQLVPGDKFVGFAVNRSKKRKKFRK